MKHAAVTQTVTHYLAKNFEKLRGAMPSEKYFFIYGRSIGERESADPKIAIGSAVDVLADLIEKEHFFGWMVPNEVSQATNPNNIKMNLLKNGDDVYGNFKIKLLKNGLFVAADKVDKRDYLDVLRTAEGFKQAAELLGIEEELEKIVSTIYQG